MSEGEGEDVQSGHHTLMVPFSHLLEDFPRPLKLSKLQQQTDGNVSVVVLM